MPVGRAARWFAVATVGAGLVGVLRHRRERDWVLAGMEPPITNSSVRPEPRHQDALSRRLATWIPGPPRGPLARLAAVLWAAPASALGLAAAASTGGVWRLDPALGALVVAGGSSGMNALQARLGFAANTLGHVVICRAADPSAELLAHEAVHVRQTERLGVALLPLYVWLMARWGYRQHPLERAARLGAAAATGRGRRGGRG